MVKPSLVDKSPKLKLVKRFYFRRGRNTRGRGRLACNLFPPAQ
jgi:hypothetical protein